MMTERDAGRVEIAARVMGTDDTIKYSFRDDSEREFEGVYFIYRGHHEHVPIETATVCLSSQAGCALGCSFCATGKGGFFGNLSPNHLIEQADLVSQDVRALGLKRPEALTLMGMGEPLLNTDSIVEFYRRIRATRKHINILSFSTVGIVPGILELCRHDDVNFRMFLSIHSPFDEERTSIIPVNAKFGLGEVLGASRAYAEAKSTRVEASYMLIGGLNDSETHAHALAGLLDAEHFDAQILLLNPVEDVPFERPSERTAEMFRDILSEKGLMTTIQVSRGIEIGAGCGQLVGRRRAELAGPVCCESSAGE